MTSESFLESFLTTLKRQVAAAEKKSEELPVKEKVAKLEGENRRLKAQLRALVQAPDAQIVAQPDEPDRNVREQHGAESATGEPRVPIGHAGQPLGWSDPLSYVVACACSIQRTSKRHDVFRVCPCRPSTATLSTATPSCCDGEDARRSRALEDQ